MKNKRPLLLLLLLLLIIIIIIIIYSLRDFHISVSWWSFTKDWVTANLLKSPGFFSVFWAISIMQESGWSPLEFLVLRLFNYLLVTVRRAPITIGVIVTFMLYRFFNSLASSRYLYFSFTFNLICGQTGQQSPQFSKFSFFLLVITASSNLVEIGRSFCMFKSHRSLFVILPDICWVVHIPFVRMVKFKFLAQLPVYHLAHRNLLLLLLLLLFESVSLQP